MFYTRCLNDRKQTGGESTNPWVVWAREDVGWYSYRGTYTGQKRLREMYKDGKSMVLGTPGRDDKDVLNPAKNFEDDVTRFRKWQE